MERRRRQKIPTTKSFIVVKSKGRDLSSLVIETLHLLEVRFLGFEPSNDKICVRVEGRLSEVELGQFEEIIKEKSEEVTDVCQTTNYQEALAI